MADYSVNIAVAVKNSQAVTQLSGKIKETGLRVNQLNNLIENFADITGTTVVNSVKNFNKALSDASGNLNNAALGTKAATEAARDYVEAQNQANAALKEQQNLLRAVRLEGKTVSDKPFGPKAAPGFDPAQGRQKAVARMVMMETAAEVKIADARRKYVLEIGQIKLDLDRKARNAEIDNILKEFKLENELQDTLFRRAIKNDEEEGRKFMEQLGFRKTAELDAIAEVDRARKKAAGEAVRLTGQTSPIGGAVGIPGSPAALAAEERAQRMQRARGSAIIGGAFPLLFGQGIGAAAGGAAGGFGGGIIGGEFGFGLSLVGTQVGTLIDQFVAGAVELGQALNPLTADIEALTNATGLAATETQKFIKQIEEEAGEKAALAAATSELALIVGTDGVNALTEFGDGSLELSRQFSIAMTQMQSVLAKFLNSIGLGKGLAGAVERTNLLRAGLANTTDPELLRLQKERRQALTGAAGAVAGAATIGIDKEIVERQRTLQTENSEELKKQAKLAAQNNDQGLRQAGILRDQLTIEELGGSLLNDRVYDLERSIIFQEAALKIANDELTPLEEANVLRERDVELQRLANKRQAEAERVAGRKLKLSEREQKAIERRVKAVERELERADAAFDKASRQLDDITRKHEDKMAFEREYSRLIREGSTPAAAKQAIELQKQLLELDRLYDRQLEVVDAQILKTESAIADLKAQKGVTTEYEEQVKALEDFKKKRDELKGKKGKARGAIEEALAPETATDKIEAEMDRIQGQINELMDPASRLIAAANAIGDAFASSFRGIVDGSMSAREALANLFQRTAEHFLDMAAQMIAAQIKMKILGLALNFGSGMVGVGEMANMGNIGMGGSGIVENSLGQGFGTFGPNFGIRQYAQGGYVSSPTRALVGEGGQGEYIIPENRMRESMARYSRGARGSAVVPEAGASGTSGEGGGTAVAAPIDVRFNVERINNVDYVTAEQFQVGLQRAAQQGATEGERRAMRSLQNSSATRRRLAV